MLDESRDYTRLVDDREPGIGVSQSLLPNPCECLSCLTGRPEYPCLIEDEI